MGMVNRYLRNTNAFIYFFDILFIRINKRSDDFHIYVYNMSNNNRPNQSYNNCNSHEHRYFNNYPAAVGKANSRGNRGRECTTKEEVMIGRDDREKDSGSGISQPQMNHNWYYYPPPYALWSFMIHSSSYIPNLGRRVFYKRRLDRR
jgi:hypothetical protein